MLNKFSTYAPVSASAKSKRHVQLTIVDVWTFNAWCEKSVDKFTRSSDISIENSEVRASLGARHDINRWLMGSR